MRKIGTLLFSLALLLSAACYRYVPVERSAVPPGSEVRAILTQDGVDEMRGTFGPNVTYVAGPLARWDEEGIGVLSELSLSRQGFPSTTMTEAIQLLPHHVAQVELRELDGKKTAGFTALLVGAAAVAVISPSLFGGEPEDPGDIPPPDDAIIVRIPFGIGGG